MSDRDAAPNALTSSDTLTFREDIQRFIVKCAIGFGVFALTVVLAGHFIAEQIDNVSRKQIAKLDLSRNKLARIEGWLDRAASAEAEISPERRAKIIANVRTLAERWGPVVREIELALDLDKTSCPSP